MKSLIPRATKLTQCRMDLARTWRRRGKFEEVTFIFPNAPAIPITVVRPPPLTLNNAN